MVSIFFFSSVLLCAILLKNSETSLSMFVWLLVVVGFLLGFLGLVSGSSLFPYLVGLVFFGGILVLLGYVIICLAELDVLMGGGGVILVILTPVFFFDVYMYTVKTGNLTSLAYSKFVFGFSSLKETFIYGLIWMLIFLGVCNEVCTYLGCTRSML